MKNYLFALLFLAFAIGATAQTKNHKIGLTAGIGFQKYSGDLGNDFVMWHWTEYGLASVSLGYYLDKSFDITLQGSLGDYGFCQSDVMSNKEAPLYDRCPGCKGRTGLGNLNSRMVSGGISFKYKLANGTIFKEDAKISPYIYLGISMNHITDRMKMKCVNAGDYFAINAGAGLKYNLNERFNISYNLGFGFFQSDKIDYLVSGSKDRYMQNTISLGVNLF